MSDDYEDREVSTTTTGPATGPATQTTTSSTARRVGGGSALWMILGLIALVAIVALVWMFARNNNAAPDTTAINVNPPTASAAVDGAADVVGNAAESVGDAAQNAGQAVENTAENATDQ